MSGCGGNIVAGCCPGPQGPPGPTGPTGPGGGGTAGVGVSIGGNTAGAPSLVSTGTLVLAGGNNVTLSQNGQSISFSAGQSVQTQAAGSIAGIGISSATQAGSTLGATLSTNGLSLAVPQWITGGGGVDVSMGGNTAGVAGLISTGTLVLAGGNNVTLSQNGNSITISANTAAAANLSVSAGSTTGAFGGLTFANGSNVSFGLNNGTITASVLAQSTQTQASGNIAGVGTTFNGANVSGSMTLNSLGLNLSLSAPVETGIGLSAAGSSQAAGTVVLSNANGVSFGMVGSTVTASVAAAGGGLDVTLGGNTSGALALISTGTLFLAGGNNVTLSQNGNSVTISANTAAAANLSVSAGTTTGAFGGLTFSNSNNISFGLNNGTITATANAPGLGTTFNGANVSGSMTLNTAGLNLSLSGPVESGVGISAAGSSQTAGNILFSNANGVSFGMAGSTVTASVVGGSAATTGGAYLQGNTTGQSSSSTYALSSLNVSGAGIISAGWSASTLIISAPGTTGLTQLSAGMSTGGNTTGTTGLASAQLVLAGGANITLSGSTNGGSMTVSIAGGAGAGGIGLQASNTTYTSGTITLQNANGITFGSSGAGGISASYNSTQFAGTGTTFAGTNISGSITQNSVGLNLALSVAAGGAAQSIGVSTGGNTAGNTGIYSGQVVFAGGNNITLSVSSGAAGAQTITISGANAGGAQTGISGLIVSNTTYTSGTVSFSNANGISFGSSAGQAITASYTQSAQAVSAQGGSSTFSTLVFTNSNGVSFSNTNGSIWGSVAAQTNQTVGLYAVGNTTQNSSTTLDARTLSFDALGAMTAGFSNGSIQLSAPATSSISGTGQVSISVNGSTISIGVPALVTNTDFYAPYEDIQLAPVQIGQGSLIFDPQPFPNVQFDRIVFPVYNANGVASSGSHSLSFYMGLYSRNASTLSLIGSTSLSTAVTHSGTLGSYSLYSGMRAFTVGSTTTLSSGNYWMAFVSRSSSAGADGSYSNMALNGGFFTDAVTGGSIQYNGFFGSAPNNSNQLPLGQGYYSTTTLGIPGSVGFSQISGTASNAGNMQAMIFASSTV